MNVDCKCGGRYRRTDIVGVRIGTQWGSRDTDPLKANWKCDRCGNVRTQRKRQAGKPLALAAIIVTAAGIISSGCTSTTAIVVPAYSGMEVEHISHPLAGFPFGPANEEDALSHLNGFVGWKKGRAYTEVTLGYSLGDSGFYGPRLTGGLRVGVMITGERER